MLPLSAILPPSPLVFKKCILFEIHSNTGRGRERKVGWKGGERERERERRREIDPFHFTIVTVAWVSPCWSQELGLRPGLQHGPRHLSHLVLSSQARWQKHIWKWNSWNLSQLAHLGCWCGKRLCSLLCHSASLPDTVSSKCIMLNEKSIYTRHNRWV